MGTSKSNNGPKGISSPIPTWPADNPDEILHIDDNDNEDENNELKPWGDVKRAYSAFLNKPSKASFKKLTDKYRNANGGNKTLSTSAVGGRKAARKLIHFLSYVSQNGFEEACREFNIGDLEGLSPEEAIHRLASIFDNIDGTDEGSAAKAAAIETINQLYEEYTENPESLDNIANEDISDYLSTYISNYIFERLSIEVSNALENNKFSKDQVIKANDTLKDFIFEEVKLTIDQENFSSLDVQQQNAIVHEILTLAYSMI